MKIGKGIRLGALTPKELRARDILDGLLEKFDWFYIGAEFCENLLPAPGELARTARFFLDAGKKVCLLTPMLSERGLTRLAAVFTELTKLAGRGTADMNSMELTINDFGALELARERGLGIKINTGRVLSENTFMLKKKRLVLLNHRALEFFTGAGVDRFEISSMGVFPGTNFRRGADGGFRLRDFHLTLFYPYLNLTSARACLMGMPEPGRAVSGINCKRECETAAFELKHPLIREKLVARGNTLFLNFPGKFYRSEKDLASLRVDRLVYSPFP